MSGPLTREGLIAIVDRSIELLDLESETLVDRQDLGAAVAYSCAEAANWDGDKAAILMIAALIANPSVGRGFLRYMEGATGPDEIEEMLVFALQFMAHLCLEGTPAQQALESTKRQLEGDEDGELLQFVTGMVESSWNTPDMSSLLETIRTYCDKFKPR